MKSMKIKNKTSNFELSRNAALCSGIWPKFLGLMFSGKSGRALVLKFEEEIIIFLHMIFVFYPIDVLFLDEKKFVVDKKENFRPFTFCNSGSKAMYAVELPGGTINGSKTKIGDKIEFWEF